MNTFRMWTHLGPGQQMVPPCVQEEVIPFFQQVRFTTDADSALKCMRELAVKLGAEMKRVDPYFEKLAEGMLIWCDLWEKFNPEPGLKDHTL
jgi:reversibly glycosylated polypeptide / UDP-arabinopyranose mutase